MFTGIRISFRCGFAVVLSILTAWGLAPTTFGQTADYWLNGNGGSYEEGSNWSLGATGAYPTFNLGSAGYTVTLNQNESAIDPVVETDNPTINLNGYTLNTDYLDVSDYAGTVGSLTLLGPGSVTGSLPVVGYVDVGGQLTVDNATIDQRGADTTISVAGTLTVENGGSVVQNGVPTQAMNIANLVVNNGTVSTQGAMSLGSATISNGSEVEAGGTFNASGNVVVDGSNLISNFGANFSPTSSLTLSDGAFVALSDQNVTLDGSVDIVSGQLQADGQTDDLDAAVTIELNANMTGVTGCAMVCHFVVEGGTLNLTLPSGFMPTSGEQFQLFDNLFTDPLTGAFGSITLPALRAGEIWDTSQLYTTGIISVVPEPTAIGLMIAASGLLIRRRRKS
jgi:hypothetical protein